MRAVFKRELASYFQSLSGYIYLSVFFLLTAYYFLVGNLMAGSNSVAEYFQNMMTTLLFLIPILTMRSFSEEKKQRTDQLLFTLPLKVSQILFAKLAAAYLVFLTGVASTLLFVVVLRCFGSVEIYTVIGCYFGILIAGMTFITLGVFISSLTESQTIAAIITYAVLFALYLVGYAGDYIRSQAVAAVVDAIAIFSRYTLFTMAVFDPSAIVYYLTLSFAFYEFTLLVLTKDAAK